MRRGPRNAGFTLTELLVVILLIGIFTGVMLAEMRGSFEDAVLRGCARQLMDGLSLASSRAVSMNQTHTFVFNAAEHEFTVRARNGGAAPAFESDGEADAARPWMEVRKVDERVTVAIRDPAAIQDEIQNQEDDFPEERAERLAPDQITFYPDGTADAREIFLRDRNNLELSLRINPVTGRVRVEGGR
jgi:type II secretion system protein H